MNVNLKSKRQPRPKPNEPSARDKLTADFTRRLEEKWRQCGDDVLDAAAKESPTKFAEMVARVTSSAEPRVDGIESANSHEEIGRRMLQSIGFQDPDDASIQAAIEVRDKWLAELQAIHARAEGAMQ